MIVAITGAGWDPVEEVRTRNKGFDIPERTPEMFWRVGAGHTVLSRQVYQFRALGAGMIFVGMGEPGCSPTVVEDNNASVYNAIVANYGRSPWTETQVAYVTNQKCVPVLMPDPHAQGRNCWTTLLRMAPQILFAAELTGDNRIVISAGDYVFRTSFLRHLVDMAGWPSQYWFWMKHSIEFLDKRGFVEFTDYLGRLSSPDQSRVWLERDYACGFPQTVWGKREGVFTWMAKDWMEVSYHSWKAILELVKEDPV